MKIELVTSITRELENAWTKEDVKACYDLLSLIPDRQTFRVGKLLLMLVPPLEEEKAMLEHSNLERRELGVVITEASKVLIKGNSGGIDLDEIAGVLHDTASPEKPAIFSHTHWDTSVQPLPGFAEIGFGDIHLFNFFIDCFPLLECRVVFNSEGGARSIVYKGEVKDKS